MMPHRTIITTRRITFRIPARRVPLFRKSAHINSRNEGKEETSLACEITYLAVRSSFYGKAAATA